MDRVYKDGAVSTRSTDRLSVGAALGFSLSADTTQQLSLVEARLRAVVAGSDERLAEMALHLVEAGGKRLRPTLVVAAAIAACGVEGVTARVVDAAVAVEFLHLASLYHDDVLDSASERRGRPSANALWGDHAAVLTGDVLLSHAYQVAAELGLKELRRLGDTLLELCAGQIAESKTQFDHSRDIAEYDSSIRGKTAALLSTSCWLGAHTAGASYEAAETLAAYGSGLGVAFQVVDDLLDLYGQQEAAGKPIGSDLREGVFTLPVLLALREDPTLADVLVAGIDQDGVEFVRERVQSVGAGRTAVKLALDHLRDALSGIAAGAFTSEGTQLLVSLAAAVLEPLAQMGLVDGPLAQEIEAVLPARRRGESNC